jgi:drug/metabolite transporter (DMT)-like permease
MNQRLRVGLGAALGTAAISGVAVFLNGLAVKESGGPATHTATKNLVAALVLGAALLAATRRRSAAGWTPPAGAAQLAGLVAVALIGGGLAFVLFFEGLAQASSTEAAILHKTLVLWVALAAPWLLGERAGWPVAAGIMGLLAGQLLLAGDLDAVGLGRPELMILGATLLWAGEVIVTKRLLATLSPLTVGTVRLSGGLIVLFGWVAISGGDLGSLGVEPWLWALATGVVLAGYVACWTTALANAPAVVVTAVLVLSVPITAALDATFQDKPIGSKLLGLTLIAVAGAVVVMAARSGMIRTPTDQTEQARAST